MAATIGEGAPVRHDDDNGKPPAVHQDLADADSAVARPRALAAADRPAGAIRGQFAYVEGATAGDEQPLPLCRLRYLGSATTWGFGLYLASSDKYEDQILPTGSFSGTATDALDCACGLYLAGHAL